MISHADSDWMRRSLRLAYRGLGAVEPNPMVGAVLVRDGRLIGEGWHERFGGPHAEIQALRSVQENPAGSTLYVTLEPCCHFGKTPPCTDALIRAGIRTVYIGVRDPFPKVDGGGINQLRAAGNVGHELRCALINFGRRQQLVCEHKCVQQLLHWPVHRHRRHQSVAPFLAGAA